MTFTTTDIRISDEEWIEELFELDGIDELVDALNSGALTTTTDTIADARKARSTWREGGNLEYDEDGAYMVVGVQANKGDQRGDFVMLDAGDFRIVGS